MILGPRQWATDRTVILEGSGERLPTTAFIADAKLLACLLAPLDPKGKNCVSVLFASLCTPRPHSPRSGQLLLCAQVGYFLNRMIRLPAVKC